MTDKIDTTGFVPTTDRAFWGGVVKWSDLSPFTQGYIEAIFQSRGLERDEDMPIAPAFSDLAPETLARIIADCEAYSTPFRPSAHAQGGHRFWVDRQRGLMRRFPPLTLQLSDDGKVRFA